jgi:glycosyltransferase involved in cell wall biosynthesis
MTDNRAQDHPRSRIVERVKSVYLSAFDGILTSGSDSKDYLELLGVPQSKIQLGYDCVDNDNIATLVAYHRASQGASRTAGNFVCIARLISRKNIPGIIVAYHSYLRQLPDSSPPIELVVCGDGPERRRLEDLIHRLGLGTLVSLVGEIQGVEALAEQLANCRALILASTRDEPWGLVVNEALAAGCPVVVSKQCGCARDLVEHGGNGFEFDGEDSEELARHMLWLHANSDLLETMGTRSREIVGAFTTSRFAASVSSLAMAAGYSS